MSYDKHSISGIERGVKVRFTGVGGLPKQNDKANKRLQVNEVYTVSHVDVHDCMSDVYLEGFEGYFNSVMFKVATELFN